MFIDLHIWNSGNEIAINTEAVSQVGDIAGHAYILRSDGGTVEVKESKTEVMVLLRNKSGVAGQP